MDKVKSLLFVPAEERRLSKIGKTDADAYIIDLEDSIAEENKENALGKTIEFLSSSHVKNLLIRVNHNRFLHEIKMLQQFDIGFMLPKIQSEDDYAEAKQFFEGRNVIALIETPRALINASLIASIPWVTALAFGAEDFTISANMQNNPESLAFPKSMLAIAAKAYFKQVYDTPCFNIHDEHLLCSELQQAVNLGYDGKLAIHPKQIGIINQTFNQQDPEYIKFLIETYEASGKAVCEINGRVYEKLHIDRLKKILASTEDESCL